MNKAPLMEICESAIALAVAAADHSPLSFEESAEIYKQAEVVISQKETLQEQARAVHLPFEIINTHGKRLTNLPNPHVKVIYKFGSSIYTGYFDNEEDNFGFWCDEEFAPADNVSGWMYYE